MYLRKKTTESTKDYLKTIKRLKNEITNADAIIIGAGAGLSTAAGFLYSGDYFQQHFSDFELKYGFHDMYSGGFYPYDTLEEYWAYWSRYILLNRYQDTPEPLYQYLFHLIKDKDYFVLTTNVDHCFQKAGFDKHRLFYTQGDYGLFQCSVSCHSNTYDNEEIIHLMVAEQKNMRIPSKLIPHCPLCGKTMTMNLRSDDTFVEDEGWHIAASHYDDFIKRHKGMHTLYLELGVGYNTPGIIKYPFWQMTYQNPKAVYACINYGEAASPKEIERQAICINNDIAHVLKDLKGQ